MQLEPIIFTDGNAFYNDLSKKYIKHSKGLFIMTPSGAGKTYFCTRQTQQHWIDGDELWVNSGAQPMIEWWNGGVPMIERVEQRCDVITAESVDLGYWVMGSICYWFKPSAIVIPKWDTLVAQIRNRQENNYDGGLTDSHLDQLKTHISIIEKWHTDHGVPKFQSIDEAVNALTDQVE